MRKQLSFPFLVRETKGSFKAKWKRGCKPTNQALIPMLKLLAVCVRPVVMDAFITPASSHGHADGVLLCLSPHGPAGQRISSAFPAWMQTRPVFFSPTITQIHTAATAPLICSTRHYIAPHSPPPPPRYRTSDGNSLLGAWKR